MLKSAILLAFSLLLFFNFFEAAAQRTFDPTAPQDAPSNFAEKNMLSFGAYRALFHGEAMVFYERAVVPQVGIELGAGLNYPSLYDHIWAAFKEGAHPSIDNESIQGIGLSVQAGAKYLLYGENLIGTYIPLNFVYRNNRFGKDVFNFATMSRVQTNMTNILLTTGFGYITASRIEYNALLGLRAISGHYLDDYDVLTAYSAVRPTIMFDLRYTLKF